ncbi:helix-turn-helix transcriptional regulator [Pseudothauera lacus]|uniref:Transcriptional regulator n=1 Tax=Pseudothauera lacus TaxID=2136175 RepID=A0A2T4IF35_9RHOO|nr:transcriptional regulator [Pseudothauera lacus]PTD96400.1 transcriptional regulator [Pseudothauera lacus]
MQPQATAVTAALAKLDNLPDAALSLTVKDLALLLGRSESSIWRDVRLGRIAPPVKTGPACTRWRVGVIRRHLATLTGGQQ